MEPTSRTERLRRHLGETQTAFGARIGASQGTVWRLETGQAETGSQQLLLDALERDIAEGRVTPKAVHLQPASTEG
jgi:transcriptional regulator with XRE-family HTH domain